MEFRGAPQKYHIFFGETNLFGSKLKAQWSRPIGWLLSDETLMLPSLIMFDRDHCIKLDSLVNCCKFTESDQLVETPSFFVFFLYPKDWTDDPWFMVRLCCPKDHIRSIRSSNLLRSKNSGWPFLLYFWVVWSQLNLRFELNTSSVFVPFFPMKIMENPTWRLDLEDLGLCHLHHWEKSPGQRNP